MFVLPDFQTILESFESRRVELIVWSLKWFEVAWDGSKWFGIEALNWFKMFYQIYVLKTN